MAFLVLMSSPLRLMFTTTNLSVLHVNYIPTKRQNRWIINESSLFLSVKFLQDDTKPFTDIFIGESPQSRSTWRTNSIGCLLTQCDSSSIWCNFLKKNCTVFGVFCRPTTPTPLQPHPTPPLRFSLRGKLWLGWWRRTAIALKTSLSHINLGLLQQQNGVRRKPSFLAWTE